MQTLFRFDPLPNFLEFDLYRIVYCFSLLLSHNFHKNWKLYPWLYNRTIVHMRRKCNEYFKRYLGSRYGNTTFDKKRGGGEGWIRFTTISRRYSPLSLACSCRSMINILAQEANATQTLRQTHPLCNTGGWLFSIYRTGNVWARPSPLLWITHKSWPKCREYVRRLYAPLPSDSLLFPPLRGP